LRRLEEKETGLLELPAVTLYEMDAARHGKIVEALEDEAARLKDAGV
jgi:hypothetical protein